jgi:DNA-binding HxlR family transcriptional regulator
LNFRTTNVKKVLEALSDEVSVNIFEIIQKYTKNTNDLKQGLHLTYKQAYSRVQKLIDAGLVKRNGSYYYMTSFGRVISQACSRISKGIECLPQLKAVDALSNGELSGEKYAELIDRLVEDIELKKVLSNYDKKF